MSHVACYMTSKGLDSGGEIDRGSSSKGGRSVGSVSVHFLGHQRTYDRNA